MRIEPTEVRAAGFGPFITLRIAVRADGTIERWESRRHRKHLTPVPARGSTWWVPQDRDWWIGILFAIGSLLFGLGVVPAFAAAAGIWAAAGSPLARHHVWRPDALGSACFLAASGLAWFEVCHRWVAWRPRLLAWWITGINLAGSVAFGVSAVASYVPAGTADELSTPAASLGIFIGAACFFAGPVLLLAERTEQVPASAPAAAQRVLPPQFTR